MSKWLDEAYRLFPPNSTDNRYRAWKYLLTKRREGDFKPDDGIPDWFKHHVALTPGAHADVSLAAAEHYAFARFLAAATGDWDGANKLTLGYEAVKVYKFAKHEQVDLKLSKWGPVNPSLDELGIGLTGVLDGITDYKKDHGGKTGRPLVAIQTQAELIQQQTGLNAEALKLFVDVANLHVLTNIWRSIKKAFPPKTVGLTCVPLLWRLTG